MYKNTHTMGCNFTDPHPHLYAHQYMYIYVYVYTYIHIYAYMHEHIYARVYLFATSQSHTSYGYIIWLHNTLQHTATHCNTHTSYGYNSSEPHPAINFARIDRTSLYSPSSSLCRVYIASCRIVCRVYIYHVVLCVEYICVVLCVVYIYSSVCHAYIAVRRIYVSAN